MLKKITKIINGDKLPILALLFFTAILFSDFFTRGYVIDANHDMREVIMPYHYLQARSIKAGNVPQWNPYVRCGVPFLGNPYNLFCYPPFYMAYLAPERMLPHLVTIILIAHVFAAGFFAYLLFKRMLYDRFWAFFASFIYLFSTSSIANITVGTSCFSFMVYMPLWLYLIYTQRERKFLLNFIFTAITLSLFFLVGSFQRVIYVFWICYAFLIFRSFSLEGGKIKFDIKPLIVNVLSSALAVAIAFIRLYPFVWNGRQGITAPGTFQDALKYGIMNPVAAIRFLVPEFFGTKLHENFLYFQGNEIMNHLEMFNCYIGLVGAMIFFYAFFFVWDRKILFWKILAALAVLMIFFPPFTYIHYALTGKAMLNYARFAWFIPISAAALVGVYGASYSREERHVKRLLIFSAAVFILSLAGVIFIFKTLSGHGDISPAQIRTMTHSIAYFSVIGVLFIAGQLVFKGRAYRWFLLGMLIIDLMIVARIDSNNSNPFLSPVRNILKYSDDELTVAKKFKEEGRLFRVITPASPNMKENRCIELGFYSSCGHDSFGVLEVTRIYAGEYHLSRGRNYYVKNPPSNKPAAKLSSSLFFMAGEKVHRIIGLDLVPRVRLYKKHVVIEDDKEAFEKVIYGGTNFAEEVVIDKSPEIPVVWNSSDKGSGRADIAEETNDQVIINVWTPDNALLFISNSYHKGWRAYLDGEDTSIIRANYGFMAVVVPRGQHKVEFRFEHPAFKNSVIISAIGLLIFMGICCFWFFVHKK